VHDSSAAFTEQEVTFLRALVDHNARFMLVGLSAAVVQGADTVTQDLDLWFERASDPALPNAAKLAGGFYSSRTQPPSVGGEGLDRIDLVAHCDGLDKFSAELARTIPLRIEDFEIRVLRIDRVLASKLAADRPKDRASIEQLKAAIAAIEESKKR